MLAAGWDHTCAVDHMGNARCCGDGGYGQLRAQQTLAMVPMKWVMTYNPSSWEQVEEFRN